MNTQRSRFETWFERRKGPREPELEATLLAAADAYDAAEASGELPPERLAVIVKAASHERALLWDSATELLGALSTRFPQAAEAVRRMFASPKAQVRFNALCCLRPETSASVVDPLLRAGLADKGANVRRRAAEKAETFDKRDLIPDMAAALSRETNARTRRAIEFHLCLLRDGYQLSPASGSGYDVTVRRKSLIGTTSWGGRRVSEEEMREKGIDAIAAELRRDKG
jgi:hypothetical protein